MAGNIWYTKELSEVLREIYRLFEKIVTPGYQVGEDPYLVYTHYQKLKHFYMSDVLGLNDVKAFIDSAEENARRDFNGLQ